MTDAVSPYAYVGNSPVNFVDPFGWAAQGATITTQSAYASATATDWTTPVGGGQTGEQYVQAQMLLRTVPAPPTGPNPGYQGITVPGGTGTRVNQVTDMPVTTPPSLADQIAKGRMEKRLHAGIAHTPAINAGRRPSARVLPILRSDASSRGSYGAPSLAQSGSMPRVFNSLALESLILRCR